MELDQLTFKYVGDKYLIRQLDEREFPLSKTVTAILSIMLVAIAGIILYRPGIFSDPMSLLPGVLMALMVASVVLGFGYLFYWMDEEPQWTPKHKTDQVEWSSVRIPIRDKYLWNPAYNKAVTDLYWHVKMSGNKKIHSEWADTFAKLNLVMEPLHVAREMNLNPLPDTQAYLSRLQIETDLNTPIRLDIPGTFDINL